MKLCKKPRVYKGKTYKVGDVINPDCGFEPTDFVIVGFKVSKSHTHMWGYHTASKIKSRFIRGFWPNKEVEYA